MSAVLSDAGCPVASPQPLRTVVVCRSEETAARWRARAPMLDGMEIVTELGCRSYYELINRIIRSGHAEPVILCHDDIRCGLGFAAAVRELVDELAGRYVRWGVCGNAGISWDGRHVYRYIKDPHGGPQLGLAAEHVLSIDGNMMLLNVPALAQAGVVLPDLGGFHGYDIALSLESLRAGLPVLCDRRLFVMHKSPGSNLDFQKFVQGAPFQGYLAQRFLNHSVPTLNGAVDVSAAQDYSYLDIPGAGSGQQDVVALFDQVMAESRRRRPSVTIGCRSQFNRPEMLTRAVATFAVAAQQAPELVDIKVRIISDRPSDVMAAELKRLQERFPGLDLDGCPVATGGARYSRTAALLTAIDQADTDFIWFVDDDDFVLPSAIRPLARALTAGAPYLAVGRSQRLEEVWTSDDGGPRRIAASRIVGHNPAEGVFHAFSGDNHTPICSIVFPAALMRERLRDVAARGDYYEDYFLLLLALTSDRIELRVVQEDFCGISLRTGENTVTEPDREHWDLSYATFMTELLLHPQATSPVLWQVAEKAGRIIVNSAAAPQACGCAWCVTKRRLKALPSLTRRFFYLWRANGVRFALGKARRFVLMRLRRR